MCLHPVMIPNPNYKRPKKGYNVLRDCTSLYIAVPCGHCPQCIAQKQSAYIQRVYMESINNYLFFVTLTYSNDSLPIFEINDFSIPFADYSDIQKMFKRIRKDNLFTRPFKYFAVSEFGGKNGRPHFHIIVSLPKKDSDNDFTPFNLEKTLSEVFLKQWSRNVGSKRKPIYKNNCKFVRKYISGHLSTNFDCHYIVPNLQDSGVSSTAFYVSKYLLKHSERENKLRQALKLNLSDEEFNQVWKDLKNGLYMSKGFGLRAFSPYIHFDSCGHDISIGAYIRKCINTSIKDGLPYPCFIVPDSGKMIPLSRFYRKYYLYPDDAFAFYYNQPDQSTLDTIAVLKCLQDSEYFEEIRKFEKRKSMIEDSDFSDIY